MNNRKTKIRRGKIAYMVTRKGFALNKFTDLSQFNGNFSKKSSLNMRFHPKNHSSIKLICVYRIY